MFDNTIATRVLSEIILYSINNLIGNHTLYIYILI